VPNRAKTRPLILIPLIKLFHRAPHGEKSGSPAAHLRASHSRTRSANTSLGPATQISPSIHLGNTTSFPASIVGNRGAGRAESQGKPCVQSIQRAKEVTHHRKRAVPQKARPGVKNSDGRSNRFVGAAQNRKAAAVGNSSRSAKRNRCHFLECSLQPPTAGFPSIGKIIQELKSIPPNPWDRPKFGGRNPVPATKKPSCHHGRRLRRSPQRHTATTPLTPPDRGQGRRDSSSRTSIARHRPLPSR